MHFSMDWKAVNFDWNRARAFLVTAEEGSLSAAARALGMAQPTLGRQVDALEKELGVVLFERVGRGLTLTPSGLDLLDHVRAMGVAANQMSLTASGHSQSLEGDVLISASEAYSAFLLPPIIAQLRVQAPGVHIEIVASNAPSDLQRREADIAMRNFRPTEPDLIAKKVRDDPGSFYATPDYLEKVGNPKSTDDLTGVDFIGFNRTDQMVNMMVGLGMKVTQENFPIVSENHLVQWQMVKQGLGLGVITDLIGEKEPAVVRALPDLAPIMVPIWLTAHREVRTSRRVRFVFDLLADALGK